jgi:hypothetical protein
MKCFNAICFNAASSIKDGLFCFFIFTSKCSFLFSHLGFDETVFLSKLVFKAICGFLIETAVLNIVVVVVSVAVDVAEIVVVVVAVAAVH